MSPAAAVRPNIRRSAVRKDSWAELAGVVLADTFENHLERFYSRGGVDRPLILDFRHTTYIEIAALVNCIATLLQRTERGYSTLIVYPRDKKVRDFLNIWRFPEAVEDATGLNFRRFLATSEDEQLLSEPQTTFTGQGDAVHKLEYDADWEPQKKTARNFFEFVTFSAQRGERIEPSGRFASAPREEGKKWTRPLIHEVLDKHLPGDTTKDDVARVIVYEALSNAVRHPSARVIQVVSKFERPGELKADSSGYLRICVWDDGDSIAQTLINALDEGRSIHAVDLPGYMCDRIYVTIRNFEQTVASGHVVDQSDKISKPTTEGRVLLASLFPGVTRTAEKEIAKVAPFGDTSPSTDTVKRVFDALGSAPGMGLYALTRTAIDQFMGSLFIRSGNYRLFIESAHDAYRVQHKVRYKCKITQYSRHMPPFRGNLLGIQLPLRRKDT
jgi:hypothetical protein